MTIKAPPRAYRALVETPMNTVVTANNLGNIGQESLVPVGQNRRVQQPLLTTTSVEEVEASVKSLQSEKVKVIKIVKMTFSLVFNPCHSFFPSQRVRSR